MIRVAFAFAIIVACLSVVVRADCEERFYQWAVKCCEYNPGPIPRYCGSYRYRNIGICYDAVSASPPTLFFPFFFPLFSFSLFLLSPLFLLSVQRPMLSANVSQMRPRYRCPDQQREDSQRRAQEAQQRAREQERRAQEEARRNEERRKQEEREQFVAWCRQKDRYTCAPEAEQKCSAWLQWDRTWNEFFDKSQCLRRYRSQCMNICRSVNY